MLNKEKKQAWVEAASDTAIGTLINFPLNIVLLTIAAYFEFGVLGTSVFLSTVFIILAIVRKYLIRRYFSNKRQCIKI